MSDMSCVGCVVCHSVSKFVVLSNHVPLVQFLRLLQDGSVLVIFRIMILVRSLPENFILGWLPALTLYYIKCMINFG